MPYVRSESIPYMLRLDLANTPLRSRDGGSARHCAGLRVRRELHRDAINSGSHREPRSVLSSLSSSSSRWPLSSSLSLLIIIAGFGPSSSLLLLIVIVDFDLV